MCHTPLDELVSKSRPHQAAIQAAALDQRLRVVTASGLSIQFRFHCLATANYARLGAAL